MNGGDRMIFKILKRMIERKQTEGIEEKIDVFYASGKITKEQYDELFSML